MSVGSGGPEGGSRIPNRPALLCTRCGLHGVWVALKPWEGCETREGLAFSRPSLGQSICMERSIRAMVSMMSGWC